MFWRLLLVLCLVAMAGFAIAAQSSGPEIMLAPDARIMSASLDDPQPDTLYYDDNTNQSYYFNSLTNYYVYVRFTPPSDFTLRSIYLAAGNPSGSTAACSLFVHLASGNNPGTQLAAAAVQLSAGSFWYDINLTDSVSFTENQSFMIVLGRSPGPTAWYPLLDGASEVNRSYYTTGNRTTGPWTLVPVDVRIRAGGSYAAFTDLSADQCFNDVSNDGAKFFFLPGDSVLLKAQVSNVSNQTVAAYSVSWAVQDPTGQYVFSDEVPAGPLAPDANQVVSASARFVPNLVGQYLATCVISATNDANSQNDTTMLRMVTGGIPRWFRYDDNGDAEGQVTFGEGSLIGLVMTPSEYPAQVESLRVYYGAAGTGSVEIYANDATGMPTGVALWSATPTVAAGWNAVRVNPPVPIYEGNSITAAVGFGNPAIALGRDNNLPNCARITNMGHVAWSSSGGGWEEELGGNWCIQSYMTMAPMPPTIAWSPDTLNFGEVDTASSVAIDLWLYNQGDGADLEITQMDVTPLGIRSAFSFTPQTLTIAAHDSDMVEVTFTPTSIRSYNGLFRITNNSDNLPVASVVIRATGTGLAVDIPEYGLPSEFALAQNYPNPFNPSTEIQFALPVATDVRLTVFNLLGQEMAVLINGTMPAGVYKQNFDASSLPAGVYFYRLEAGTFSDIKKMMLLK